MGIQADATGISAERENLQRLILIRAVVIAGQALALYIFTYQQPLDLPAAALLAVLLGYLFVTLLAWARSQRALSITGAEIFAHLLVDIGFFSVLLYYSGGASNPFISYYLIPISIAAIVLPGQLSLLLAAISLLAYSALLKYYVAIPALEPGHHHGGGLNLHILGMWVNFALSAAIITYFISRMAATIRQQQKEIALQREEQLRDEQLLAIGTLAAGTAHELGTPLNTMKILADEMLEGCEPGSEEARTLQQQIDLCRDTLRQLVDTARESDSGDVQMQALGSYFEHLVERWRLLRPDVRAEVHYAPELAQRRGAFHPTIAQSLLNLLNNAGDASPERVDITIACTNDTVEVRIRDFGAGLDADKIDSLGTAFSSDKSTGLGLGLFLSQASLTRYGGSVSLQNAGNGPGTVTTVRIPVDG